MSKTNSAVLRCHFHWLLDQRSASNRETTLRIYLKIIKRACVCVCVHLKAQGEHEPYFIGRRIFTLRYFIHWTIHGINISSTLFGYITECLFSSFTLMNTHRQKKPKTVIKQQSNNAYKLFITWHEFKPSFCLLLLLTAVHVVSPCSFCFFILCFIPAT